MLLTLRVRKWRHAERDEHIQSRWHNMAEKAYLAVDMGASSGRHVLGLFDGQRLRLEEVYRFENGPVEVAGRLHWDLLGQWSHVRQGLRAAGAKMGGRGRQRRRRYLGRRLRPAGTRRRTVGQSLPLPRRTDQRPDGKGVRHRQPGRHLPPHRPAVHAVQHALSTAGDEARRLAAAGHRRIAADGARPVPLAAGRREVQRDDRGQHEPVLQSRPKATGPRSCSTGFRCPRAFLGRSPSRGRRSGRCGPIWPPRAGWRRPAWCCPARTTRPAR